MTEKINLSEKFASFFDYFSPRTVAQFNGTPGAADAAPPSAQRYARSRARAGQADD